MVRAECCAEDPQLAEFLRLMQPRHKNALWADEPVQQPPHAAKLGAEQQADQGQKQGRKQKQSQQQDQPLSADTDPDELLQAKRGMKQRGASAHAEALQDGAEDGQSGGQTGAPCTRHAWASKQQCQMCCVRLPSRAKRHAEQPVIAPRCLPACCPVQRMMPHRVFIPASPLQVASLHAACSALSFEPLHGPVEPWLCAAEPAAADPQQQADVHDNGVSDMDYLKSRMTATFSASSDEEDEGQEPQLDTDSLQGWVHITCCLPAHCALLLLPHGRQWPVACSILPHNQINTPA